jgi:aromatic ring-opening dioxygenase catalytic subunit (LigB family)
MLERGAMMNATPLPTFYISHGGGPCFWMEANPPDLWDRLGASLQGIPAAVGVRPKAILAVSAHWIEREFTVQTHPRPPLLYDYYGFPEHTYRLKYDAPGSPALAERVQALLTAAGMPVQDDGERGYDHGLFVPFLKIYPQADIPIIQLSIRAGFDPGAHLALGRALAPLRSEGVLIVGSGFSFHNLRHFGDPEGRSKPFDDWLNETLCASSPEARHARLLAWEQAPAARFCQPQEDHLVPLFVAAGAAGADAGHRIYAERMQRLQIYVSSFQFGETVRQPA